MKPLLNLVLRASVVCLISLPIALGLRQNIQGQWHTAIAEAARGSWNHPKTHRTISETGAVSAPTKPTV